MHSGAVLRSALVALVLSILGAGAFGWLTDGLQAFTSDAALRRALAQRSRTVPDVLLQTATGEALSWSQLRGRWLLVDFIYTRCETYCSAQAGDFARLQQRLHEPLAQQRLLLVSVSFDGARDAPAQLAQYQRRFGGHGPGWIAARVPDAAQLAALLATFGVRVLPDRLGGFVHNAGFALVDPRGELVALFDASDLDAALRRLSAGGVL